MKGAKPAAPPPVRTAIADFLFRESLDEIDADAGLLCRQEEDRQAERIILIASESIAPRAVREAMSTVFANVYAEGYPSNRLARRESARLSDQERHLAFYRRYGDRRFYKGTELANFIEVMAQRRAAEIFASKAFAPEDIYVNVQPLSGAAANNAVYEAFLVPGDPVVGLNLSHGGHLTHGSPANRSGKRYRVTPYHLNAETGLLDYEEIARVVSEARPKLLIGGGSAYPYDIDWVKLREIADSVDAILLADISHPAGLIAAGLLSNPVGIAHVTSLTTHKTLCGPRGAILLSTDASHARALDSAVFPGEQGGPHLHQIAGKAVAFALAQTPKFKALMKQVIVNTRTLIKALTKEGVTIAHGCATPDRINALSENDPATKKKELNYTHLFTIDLKGFETKSGVPITGDVAANILDLCGITLNKNTLAGDTNASRPSGIRIGTTFMTQRGFTESHMQSLAGLIARILKDTETFEIDGGAGPVVRARISPEALEQHREAVRRLTHEGRWDAGGGMTTRILGAHVETALTALHKEAKASLEDRKGFLVPLNFGDAKAEREAVDKGCALFDMTDLSLHAIRGERARPFVAQAFASRTTLAPGECAPAVLLSPSGETTDEPVLLRLPEGKDGTDEFWLFDADSRTPKWLEALSDGWVRFDTEDVYAKVDGPVAIEDLRTSRHHDRRVIAIGLAGPKAAALLKAVCAPFGALQPGRWAEGAVDGAIAQCARPGAASWYVIFTTPNEAQRVWTKLKKEGATPSGERAREAAKRDEAKPDLTKPYFIGVRTAGPKEAKKETFAWKEREGALLKSCLYAQHLEKDKAGAKGRMVPFAGYEMPVLYTTIGDEHNAVRERAGLFDISHMGTIEVAGPNAARFIDLVTSNYVPRLRDGQTQYSYVLDPEGRVLDDILVYRRAWDRFLLVVNASNADKLWAWFSGVAARRYVMDLKRPAVEIEGDVTLRDLKNPSSGADQLVDIALQGPKSLAILQRAAESKAARAELKSMKKSDFIETKLCGGIKVLVSKTGYTGENTGFELYVHPADAPKLWAGLLEAGEKHGIQRCGLGSRDSTRTEVGFPLYGHELSGKMEIIPSEAGYGAFVKRHKPFFVGRDALIAREAASKNTIVRFKLNSEKGRAIRTGYPVANLKGQRIGEVTSCTLVGKAQIGLAYIDKRFAKDAGTLAIMPVAPEDGDHGKKAKKDAPAKAAVETWVIPELATILERFTQMRVEGEEEE